MRRLIHFDRSDAGRLHCDNPECNLDLPRGAVVWGEHLIGYSCPRCGDNMLTRRDYEDTEKVFARIEWLNKWFSWLPWAVEKGDPRLTAVSFKTHDGKTETRIEPKPDAMHVHDPHN